MRTLKLEPGVCSHSGLIWTKETPMPQMIDENVCVCLSVCVSVSVSLYRCVYVCMSCVCACQSVCIHVCVCVKGCTVDFACCPLWNMRPVVSIFILKTFFPIHPLNSWWACLSLWKLREQGRIQAPSTISPELTPIEITLGWQLWPLAHITKPVLSSACVSTFSPCRKWPHCI